MLVKLMIKREVARRNLPAQSIDEIKLGVLPLIQAAQELEQEAIDNGINQKVEELSKLPPAMDKE